MPNVYLIGMPGCGKTTVGKKAAPELGLTHVDLDWYVETVSGQTIADIFRNQGEKAFRDLETIELARASRQEGLLVSTGGGTVLRPENVEIMQKSGLIVFIDRPLRLILKTLKTAQRPLLREDPREKLQRLYAERYPLYLAASDVVLESTSTRKQAVNDLVVLLKKQGF